MNIIRSILNAKPPAYSSSLFLNVLGMQWLLIAYYHALYSLKGVRTPDQKSAPYLAALERDGIVAVPDFFSSEEHAAIAREYDSLASEFAVSNAYNHTALPHVERLSIEDPRVSRNLHTLFMENDLIRSIAQAFLRRKKLPDVRGYLTKVFIRNEEELHAPQNGGTNNVHTDAPLRVLKFFYFVDDVTDANAPLEYAWGSHRRNTLKRLLLEYALSVRYARNKKHPPPPGEYVAGRPWVTLSDEDLKNNNLTLSPLYAKANTLVIADVGGFHRRGAFRAPGERRTVEINFRNVDILKNYLKAFWS